MSNEVMGGRQNIKNGLYGRREGLGPVHERSYSHDERKLASTGDHVPMNDGRGPLFHLILQQMSLHHTNICSN